MKTRLLAIIAVIFTVLNSFAQVSIIEITNDSTGKTKYLIARKNKPVDNIQYDEADGENGYMVVGTRNNDVLQWGAYSKEGKLIIPVKYDMVEFTFYEKGGPYFIAHKNKLKTLFDSKGNRVGGESYSNIDAFCGGEQMVVVMCTNESYNEKYGFVDLVTRNEIISCELDGWQSVGSNLVIIRKDQKRGLMNASGILLPIKYTGIELLWEKGILSIRENESDTTFTVFNAVEKKMLPGMYNYVEAARDANEKMAVCAEKNGKYGMIDLQGKVLIPFEHPSSFSFDKGKAMISTDTEIYYIDKNNKRVK
jgi:hypothetical protein